MKKYLAYDDYNRKLYDDPSIGGAIRPHIAVPYCCWKVLEINLDKIQVKKNENILSLR